MEVQDKIKIDGIQSMGFGIMPKAVAKDKRLSIESKAIYAYFVSYAGAGNSAFPKLKTILEDLTISEKRFYKHRKDLIELGYISVKAFRNEKQVIYKNVYTLHTNPETADHFKEKIMDEGVSVKTTDRVSVKMTEGVSVKTTDRGIRQNDCDKLIITKENINNRQLTNKDIDDDDINKQKNSIAKIQNLIQEKKEIKILAQELIAMSIPDKDVMNILDFFANDINLINPDIIQQQLKTCEYKRDSQTGLSSFSAYFIQGYTQKLEQNDIMIHDEFAINIKQKLGLENEELPTIPMYNWLK